jgi:phosphoenolpyruvate carboxykinase (ATP)
MHTVVDALTESSVWWVSHENFQRLYEDFIEPTRGRKLFAQDLLAVPIRNTRSIRGSIPNMLGTPCSSGSCRSGRPNQSLRISSPELTIVDLLSFRADPKRHGVRSESIIAIDF